MINSIEDLFCEVSKICVCWDQLIELGICPDVAFSKNEDVVPLAEGVSKEGNWFENNFRVLSRGLVRGRAIVVPIWEVCEGSNFLVEGSALAAKGNACSVNPDVLSDNFTALVNSMKDVVLVRKVNILISHLECLRNCNEKKLVLTGLLLD
jgi:hypothetical protein